MIYIEYVNLRTVPHTNPNKAPNAIRIACFCSLLSFKAPKKAPKNGPINKPNGAKNKPIKIPKTVP